MVFFMGVSRGVSRRLIYLVFTTNVFIFGNLAQEQCNKPPAPPSDGGCIKTNPPLSKKAVEALKNAIVDVSPDETIIVKGNDLKDVSFEVKIDRTDIPNGLTVTIVSYINDCQFTTFNNNDFIECEEIDCKNFTTRKCTLKNLSISNDTVTVKVQYFLLVKREDPFALAYFTCISPSYLLVEEEPPKVPVLGHTITCNGVSLSFDTDSISPDTQLVCRLHDNEDKSKPLYHQTCVNEIPANVFRNHTGIYTLDITPKKTKAEGERTNYTIDLGKDAIKVGIKHLSLLLIGDEYFALIVLEVNHTCPLTVPDYIFPISVCFEEIKRIEKIPKDLESSEVNFKRIVKRGQWNCTLKIEDSAGNVIYHNETFNTLITQNASLYQVSYDKYSVLCDLISVQNNNDVGCLIEYTLVLNSSNGTNSSTEILSATMSDNKAGFIEFNGPGTYRIDVRDRGDKGYEPVIRTSVTINPNPTTASQSPFSTVNNEHAEEGATNVNGLAITIGSVLGAFCIVFLIVIIILVVLLVRGRWKRHKNRDTRENSGSTTERNGLIKENDEIADRKSTSNRIYESVIPEQSSEGATPQNTLNIVAEKNESNEASNKQPIASAIEEQNDPSSIPNSEQVITLPPMPNKKTDDPNVVTPSVPSTNKDEANETAPVHVGTISEGEVTQTKEKLQGHDDTLATFTPTSSLNSIALLQAGVELKDKNVYTMNEPFGTDIPPVNQSETEQEYTGGAEPYIQGTTGTSSITDPSAPLLVKWMKRDEDD